MNIWFQLALSLLVALALFGAVGHDGKAFSTPFRIVGVLFWTLMAAGALQWIWQ